MTLEVGLFGCDVRKFEGLAVPRILNGDVSMRGDDKSKSRLLGHTWDASPCLYVAVSVLIGAQDRLRLHQYN